MGNNISRFSGSESCSGDSNFPEVVQLTKTAKTENGEEILEVGVEDVNEVLGNPKYKDHFVAIYTVAGPTRTGKSFLLSLLWHYLQHKTGKAISSHEWSNNADKIKKVFKWKRGQKSCTQGIYILKDPIIISLNGKTVALFLMDTQGIFDHNTSERNQTFLGTFSFLLSSFICFNVQNKIDPNHLEFVYKCDNSLREIDESRAEQKITSIMFVVRDWICIGSGDGSNNDDDVDDEDQEFPYGIEGGKKYIVNLMQKGNAHKAKQHHTMVEYLDYAFGDNISCCLLPHPGNAVFRQTCSMANLNRIFCQEIFKFFREMENEHQLKVKKIKNQSCKCQELCEAIKDCVYRIRPHLDASDRHESYIENDIREKMSEEVKVHVEEFINLSMSEKVWDDIPEAVSNKLDKLKEENQQKFQQKTGKLYPQRIVNEWEEELNRVLSQVVLNLMVSINVDDAYKQAILCFQKWLEDKAKDPKKANYKSEAENKRESLLEQIEKSIQQSFQSFGKDNDACSKEGNKLSADIFLQCKKYFNQHTNKLVANVDKDIDDFLSKMKTKRNYQATKVLIGLTCLAATGAYLYFGPVQTVLALKKAIEAGAVGKELIAKKTFASVATPLGEFLFPSLGGAASCYAGGAAADAYFPADSRNPSESNYYDEMKKKLASLVKSDSSLELQQYEKGEMKILLSFGTIAFNLEVRKNLNESPSLSTVIIRAKH